MTNLQKNIFECVDKGMTGKEIAEQLNCSESNVKKVRADKELREQYDAIKLIESPLESLREFIPQAIADIKSITQDRAANPMLRLTAYKQLNETIKQAEPLFPPAPQKHVLKVVYEGEAEMPLETDTEQPETI